MEALSGKTTLLVTHQVDFLPAFDSILVGISLSVPLSYIFNFVHFLERLTYLNRYVILFPFLHVITVKEQIC